jgi:hypothetical protein
MFALAQAPISQVFMNMWAPLLAATLFASLDAFLYLTTGLWYIRPVYWTVAALLISLPVFAKQLEQAKRLINTPVGLWSIGFLALSALYLIFAPRTPWTIPVIYQHIHFVILFWLFFLVFQTAPRPVAIVLAACTVGAGMLNWLEFFRPLPSNTFDCRAVGTYLNPNGAASALVFGMLAGLPAVPDRARAWFIMAVGVFILPTYSRSGILAYVVAILVLLTNGTVDWRGLVRPVAVAAVTVSLLFLLAYRDIGGREACVSYMLKDRQNVMSIPAAALGSGNPEINSQPSEKLDFSANERIVLLKKAISEYRENWLLGKGLGSTWPMFGGPRTHNMYLEKGIEMGVLGLLLWPAFLFSVVFSCRGHSRRIAWALLWSGLAVGWFSHNLFESRQILIAAALLVAMSSEQLKAGPST